MNLYLSLFFAGLASIFAVIYWLPKKLVSYYLSNYGILHKIELNYPFNNKKPIAITIDDVPYGSNSFKEILDKLDEQKVKVTFFVLSGLVNDKNKELLVRAVKSGHQLANHGKIDRIHAKLTYEELSNEISHCNETIEQIYKEAGVKKPNRNFYRPGVGFLSKNIIKLAKDMSFTITLGLTYPHDPQVPFSEINYNYLKTKTDPGDIVILHDRSWTSNLLEKFIPWLMENNYQCLTLAEATATYEEHLEEKYSDDTQDTDDSDVSIDLDLEDSNNLSKSTIIKKNLEKVTKDFDEVTQEIIKNLS